MRLGPPCRRPIFTAKAERDDALAEFLNGSPRVIYSNTVVNGPLLAELRPLGGKDRDACARTTEIHRTLGAARLACSRDPLLKFVWIGGDPVPYMEQVRSAGLEGRVLFLGNRTESRRYYYVGHIFLLSSREDPCPLVALEAADAGQWRKGLSQARAKYVWVAESDDVAEPAVP